MRILTLFVALQVTELDRVVPVALCMLVPVRRVRDASVRGGRASVPWFVGGFLAMVLLNSFLAVPWATAVTIRTASKLLLVHGLVAAGLQAYLTSHLKVGLRPVLVALGGWPFIATLGLTPVKMLM